MKYARLTRREVFTAMTGIDGRRHWRRRSGVMMLSLASTIAAAGCATAGRPGEIPLGQWSGRGMFVYERWDSDDTESDAVDRPTVSREYDTTLSVRSDILGGQDIVRLEIVSKRGSLPGLHIGDQTHLQIALAEAKRVSDSTVLYRMVGSLLNPEPDETLELEDDAPPVSATCTTRHGVTVLQLQYAEDFVDVFRFQGRRVEKTGMWFDENGNLIHWRERLEQQR